MYRIWSVVGIVLLFFFLIMSAMYKMIFMLIGIGAVVLAIWITHSIVSPIVRFFNKQRRWITKN
jgi:hypothetical protein